MSDVYENTDVQLPIQSYFDAQIYEAEQKALFQPGPQYVGHTLMVPEPDDYYVLESLGQGAFLKRTQSEVVLSSNICRHRQALMLQGRGNAPNTVCPLHRWTYDNEGKLMGAPHFPKNPCLHLPIQRLTDWNGMLFTGERDIAADMKNLGCRTELDFSGYAYHHTEVMDYAINWKTFIEVYLEDYHVDPFHPGLGRFVECADLRWEFAEQYSVQTVGVHGALEKPGSKVYQNWHDQIHQVYQGKMPAHGAIWMVYYPNIMIEWYPHTLVVSTIVPKGPRQCTNIMEFYYPEEIVWFEPDFIAAQQAAYLETALEDEEIILRMEAGREVLYRQGINNVGPYQSPMEDGMRHFHTYIRSALDSSLL
jgi:choline monooxygenase